ncbi:maltase 1 isoform X1 [Bemisia tabaci]|uniref:maltase 1 isoform X1 n=1 Tax=Bemisia tabaci TaxID=7038 RepID=UPI003B28261E
MKDNGYDVADYTGVNPLLGTLDDVKKLINATHDRGMKFLMDFVPNHSSDECEWFKLSLKRVDPFTNFYIWKDGVPINATHTTNPNNWASRFTGSAWTWREERKQYYLHQFAKNQPDLNFRDPKTRQTVESAVKFWLDLGCDGFRLDAPKHVFEDSQFKDKPQIHDYRTVPNEWFALDHIYTMALPESYGLVRDWGALLNEYKKRDGRTRILMTEDYDSPAVLIKYLENATSPGAQIPLYLTMTEMSSTTNASRLDWWVHSMSDVFPQGYFNWALDNHDNHRVTTRFTPESVDAMNMLTLLLPGVATMYYGTEIGMPDIKVRPDQRQDKQPGAGATGDDNDSRDASRNPMIWDDSDMSKVLVIWTYFCQTELCAIRHEPRDP